MEYIGFFFFLLLNKLKYQYLLHFLKFYQVMLYNRGYDILVVFDKIMYRYVGLKIKTFSMNKDKSNMCGDTTFYHASNQMTETSYFTLDL